MLSASYELLEVEIDLFDIFKMNYKEDYEKSAITKFTPSIRPGFTSNQSLIDITITFEAYRNSKACSCEIACKFQIITDGYELIPLLKDNSDAQEFIAKLCDMSFSIFIGIFTAKTVNTDFKNYPVSIRGVEGLKASLSEWFKSHG